MSCIKEFTCTRTFRGGDLYWNTANYQYILRGWKWPNHYFNLCNYFMKLYYRSNIVKKKFLKEWKCFDYNIHVLLSTSIPTGVHTPKFSEGKKPTLFLPHNENSCKKNYNVELFIQDWLVFCFNCWLRHEHILVSNIHVGIHHFSMYLKTKGSVRLLQYIYSNQDMNISYNNAPFIIRLVNEQMKAYIRKVCSYIWVSG